MTSPVSIYFGDTLGAYGFGDGHPFGPDRIHAFWKETTKRGLDKKVSVRLPRACTDTDLALFHTPEYINRTKTLSAAGLGFLDAGTGAITETGKGRAKGRKLNIPAPPDSTDAFFNKVWPTVESFIDQAKPEIIILQAGADSIDGDPITHMRFTPAAHRQAAAALCRLADKHCDGRIIALGGGGYNRNNLALGWNDVVEAMLAV